MNTRTKSTRVRRRKISRLHPHSDQPERVHTGRVHGDVCAATGSRAGDVARVSWDEWVDVHGLHHLGSCDEPLRVVGGELFGEGD